MSPTEKTPWDRTATLLAHSCRAEGTQNIGLEIERIGLWPDGYTLHYRPGGPAPERPGAEQLLTQLAREDEWKIATYSETLPLGLQGLEGKVSLEPGSQLEYAPKAFANIGQTKTAVEHFETHVANLTNTWGLHWIGLGVNPCTAVDQMDVIPLTRYHLMTEYLGARGSLATSMMRLTSSVQLNFDYSSEEQAIEMLRVALAVAPISSALFANSPISGGKPNGWLSYRSEIWRHTDSERCGLLPEAFEEGFDLVAYAKLCWKRPLMFAATTSGKNVASHRRNLHEISMGQLDGCEADDENELNCLRQVFTEARLKPGYVEIRSIDGLRAHDRYSAVAFWTGLLYDPNARALALDRLGTLSSRLREELWVEGSRQGLKATVGGISIKSLGTELMEAARKGLKKRALGEEKFLQPLEKNLHEGKTPADRVLELFHGPWKESLAELIRYSADLST